MLILLGITQTITLWLGDMTSHNFFTPRQERSDKLYYVYPKQVWVIHKYAYNIGGNHSAETRRYRLLEEVISGLRRPDVKVSSDVKVSYKSLLQTQGIIYEFGTGLTLGELMGKSFMVNNKEVTGRFKSLFVDVSESRSYSTQIYLIDEADQVSLVLTLSDQLIANRETLAYFTDQNLGWQKDQYKYYQASLLNNYDNVYFKKNIFYPISNKEMPLHYEQVSFEPVIIEGEYQKLEDMVNSLFTNPIYKHTTPTATGIIFNDNLNLNVKYDKKGILSFNKTVGQGVGKLTAAQRINKIYGFIEETTAIPADLKKGLYLKAIEKEKGEYTYAFGYEYKNFDVILSQEIKETLEIENFLELTIKNEQIISGKWLMLTPQVVIHEKEVFTTEYNEVLSFLSDSLKGEEGKLENLECAYIFEKQNSILKFAWVSCKEGEIFY